MDGPMNFIIFYTSFFLVVAFIGGLFAGSGIGVSGADITALPSLDNDNLNILDYITFGFELVVYFLGLQGLAVVGVPAVYAGMFAVVCNVTLLYVMVRLVRGGG